MQGGFALKGGEVNASKKMYKNGDENKMRFKK